MSRKDPPCKLLNVTAETIDINDEDEYDDYLCSEEDYNVSGSSDGDDDEYESEEYESEEVDDDYSNTAYSSNNDEEAAVEEDLGGSYFAFHVDCKGCGVSTSHLCNIGYCIDGLSCNEEECSNGLCNQCHISKTTARRGIGELSSSSNKPTIEHKTIHHIMVCIKSLIGTV